ncbi:cobalt-precorrin-5B (C(1))-methyltransferase CbiD [Eubacterium pyruvativorans]|uniref:cobalt-precorrin-5B (C(1))-methyltransferase CbiD n=1 Tax=Eubacterium pyruvativorans TaxID=155865 RepID=UPI0013D55E5E|nr:cobalt-precorrin-5B (C(1))-methyltransferase CbiD [Eubacterium pyruvativorans]MCI5747003.1 cobalt-precorrin-5B (C(1))-methyltransferase CbiD [Eubacterium pyruvativorans]
MTFDHYLRSGSELLRCGYTTGTCAALGARGALTLLLSGKAPGILRVMTPKGWPVETEPVLCEYAGAGAARCGIRKDGGDDADATDGMLVITEVSFRHQDREILFHGGPGVGTVTKPGLDQPVGEPAINRVPREMIRQVCVELLEEADCRTGLDITVSIPGGEEAARKTFNPMLGVEGGLSILGTSGIVEPMSERALVDTIETEMRQKTRDCKDLILTPGNYGMAFLEDRGMADTEVPVVKYSNFLGEALDMASVFGVSRILLVGHIGKIVKVAGGLMNTHSRYGDCRKEILTAWAAAEGAGRAVCRQLMEAMTTEDCIRILRENGLDRQVLSDVTRQIQKVLDRRSAEKYRAGALFFSREYGVLGTTETAKEIISEWKNEKKVFSAQSAQDPGIRN